MFRSYLQINPHYEISHTDICPMSKWRGLVHPNDKTAHPYHGEAEWGYYTTQLSVRNGTEYVEKIYYAYNPSPDTTKISEIYRRLHHAERLIRRTYCLDDARSIYQQTLDCFNEAWIYSYISSDLFMHINRKLRAAMVESHLKPWYYSAAGFSSRYFYNTISIRHCPRMQGGKQ